MRHKKNGADPSYSEVSLMVLLPILICQPEARPQAFADINCCQKVVLPSFFLQEIIEIDHMDMHAKHYDQKFVKRIRKQVLDQGFNAKHYDYSLASLVLNHKYLSCGGSTFSWLRNSYSHLS